MSEGSTIGVAPPGETTCSECGATVEDHTYLNDVSGVGYLCGSCTQELLRTRPPASAEVLRESGKYDYVFQPSRKPVVAGGFLLVAAVCYLGLNTNDPINPSPFALKLSLPVIVAALLSFMRRQLDWARRLAGYASCLPWLVLIGAFAGLWRIGLVMSAVGFILSIVAFVVLWDETS
jgi:hypothetical protein